LPACGNKVTSCPPAEDVNQSPAIELPTGFKNMYLAICSWTLFVKEEQSGDLLA